MAFSFYNTRKPRQFNHKPIYWDPRKEALEERVLKAKKELGLLDPDEEYKPQIKGTFIEGTTLLKRQKENGETAKSLTSKNIKLAIALVLLLILFWYLFLK